MSTDKYKDEQGPLEGRFDRILFNETGSRMCCIYSDATTTIWNELNCLSSFNKEKRIMCSCAADLVIEKKNKTSKAMNLFIIGCENGAVWYANDSRCDELCKLSSAVISIMFYQENQSLVIVADNYNIRIAKLSSSTSSPERKFKLSLSVDPRFVKLSWIEPCSFGVSSNESLIRMWNLKDDINYSLNLSDLNRDGSTVTFIMGTLYLIRQDRVLRV